MPEFLQGTRFSSLKFRGKKHELCRVEGSSEEQWQEIDTKEKAALPAGDGNSIYLQTKAPLPAHSLLSTPETQMGMKKGIMLERQLGGEGEGKGVEGEERGGGREAKPKPASLPRSAAVGTKEGKVSLPRALQVCVFLQEPPSPPPACRRTMS